MGVEAGSPAEKAGYEGRRRDYRGQRQASKAGNDLVNPIAQAPIGSKVKMDYVRDRALKENNRDRGRSHACVLRHRQVA